MNAYVKGAILAAAIIGGIIYWYQANVSDLPVNQSPKHYKALDQMEKEGVPDFTLNRMDGTQLKLSDLRGKIVIVNFWASWCNPCVQEFPSMMKLVEQMNGDVVIVAVSTDDQEADINTFTKAFGLPKPNFEVVWDKDKAVMKSYLIDKIPESFIVGKNGKLIRKILGIDDWATPDAISYFRSLLDGKIPGQENK